MPEKKKYVVVMTAKLREEIEIEATDRLDAQSEAIRMIKSGETKVIKNAEQFDSVDIVYVEEKRD